MNYWFISKIDNFICKCSSQLDICLTYCFFSFLGDNNIWWQFLHFVITLIEEDFATQMVFFVFKPSLNWDTVSHIVWKLDNQYHKRIVLNNMTVIQYWDCYLVFDSEWVSSYIALTSYSYPFFFRYFISTRMFFCITWCPCWDILKHFLLKWLIVHFIEFL